MLVTKKGLDKKMVEVVNDIEKEMNIPLEDVGFCITKNKDNLFDLKSMFSELEEEVNNKFYHVEDDIYELNEMKDNLEYYDFDNMESGISNLEYELGEVQEKIEELEEQLEEIPSIYDVQDEMEEVRESVNDLEWKSDDMEDDISTLKKQNKELMEKVEMLMKVIDVLAVGK